MSQRELSFNLGGTSQAGSRMGYPRGNTQRALAPFQVAPVGAAVNPDGSSGGGGWSLPWAALPLAIHRVLNGGKSGIVDVSQQNFAVFIYETDRVVRVAMWLTGALLGSYIAAVAFPENVLVDTFTWVCLGSVYIAIYINIMSSLVGRFNSTADFTIEELAARSELRLPWLMLNYQSFGLDRVDGVFAALIVVVTHLIGAAAWGLTLYVTAVRMFEQGPYRIVYTMIWGAFAGTGILNALASSVSFADARDVSSKVSAPLTSSEALRVNLIQLKVFWVLTVCLPLVVAYALYAAAGV